MQIRTVALEKIEDTIRGELSSNYYGICHFCGKIVLVKSTSAIAMSVINKDKDFHCPFCIRNAFNSEEVTKNVLVFSFRAIIGYYHACLYKARPRKLYYTQIEEYINEHVEIGLQSPLLAYDPDTFKWFADFGLIGQDQEAYEELKVLIAMMYASFRVEHHMWKKTSAEYWEKFVKAVDEFMISRVRPDEKKHLIPTFIGLVNNVNPLFLEQTRNFERGHFTT
jgi:hypothetical protein